MSARLTQDQIRSRPDADEARVLVDPPAGGRVVVLDVAPPWVAGWQRTPPRLMLLDVQSGRVTAEVRTGLLPDVAVSRDGSLIAIVSDLKASPRTRAVPHLTVLGSGDLGVLAEGPLPFDYRFRRFPHIVPESSFCFSPDNKTILVLSPSEPGGHKNGAAESGLAYYVPVDWRASGARPFPAARSFRTATTPFEGANPILSTRAWPRVVVGDRNHNAVVTIDLEAGGAGNPYRLFDLLPPVEGGRVKHPGFFVDVPAGEVAAFVPEPERPGPIRLVGLAGAEPKILDQSRKTYGDIQRPLAASERLLFAAVVRGDETPREVRVMDMENLEPVGSLDLGVGCKSLHASGDGSSLYAVSWTPPSVAAIDVRNGKIRRFLEGVATGPLLALPVRSGGRG